MLSVVAAGQSVFRLFWKSWFRYLTGLGLGSKESKSFKELTVEEVYNTAPLNHRPCVRSICLRCCVGAGWPYTELWHLVALIDLRTISADNPTETESCSNPRATG